MSSPPLPPPPLPPGEEAMCLDVITLDSSEDELGHDGQETCRKDGLGVKRGGAVGKVVGLLAHFNPLPRTRDSIPCPICQREFASEREVRHHVEWCLKQQAGDGELRQSAPSGRTSHSGRGKEKNRVPAAAKRAVAPAGSRMHSKKKSADKQQEQDQSEVDTSTGPALKPRNHDNLLRAEALPQGSGDSRDKQLHMAANDRGTTPVFVAHSHVHGQSGERNVKSGRDKTGDDKLGGREVQERKGKEVPPVLKGASSSKKRKLGLKAQCSDRARTADHATPELSRAVADDVVSVDPGYALDEHSCAGIKRAGALGNKAMKRTVTAFFRQPADLTSEHNPAHDQQERIGHNWARNEGFAGGEAECKDFNESMEDDASSRQLQALLCLRVPPVFKAHELGRLWMSSIVNSMAVSTIPPLPVLEPQDHRVAPSSSRSSSPSVSRQRDARRDADCERGKEGGKEKCNGGRERERGADCSGREPLNAISDNSTYSHRNSIRQMWALGLGMKEQEADSLAVREGESKLETERERESLFQLPPLPF